MRKGARPGPFRCWRSELALRQGPRVRRRAITENAVTRKESHAIAEQSKAADVEKRNYAHSVEAC